MASPLSFPLSGGPPGGLREPFWSHLGFILASFWSLRGSIFEPPEVDFRASGDHVLTRFWELRSETFSCDPGGWCQKKP